jgi:CubicO group peptidase (beta-lactamase class C family)
VAEAGEVYGPNAFLQRTGAVGWRFVRSGLCFRAMKDCAVRRCAIGAVALVTAACTMASRPPNPVGAWRAADLSDTELPAADPAHEGLALGPLVEMANWVGDHRDTPIFSVLLSRHGRLVFELYSPGIERDDAHYMMSTTKSVTSAIVGAALDRGLLPGSDARVVDVLPARLFGNAANAARFANVTLKDVMGMSALDANEPPHDTSPAAVARGKAFWAAPNRVVFALTQPLLPNPGSSYQYNDVTPMVVGGAVQYATGMRLFDFANEALFGPMGFKNAEWMHEDPTGLDLASYGLRLRPVDMQKLGILFMNRGRWGDRQLLSREWVDTSWTAYMRTGPAVTPGFENYGWFWWHRADWGTELHWTNGWRGQFIVDLPAYDAVFTMTADIETGDEVDILGELMKGYVIPALDPGGPTTQPELEGALAAALLAAHTGPSRIPALAEPRMIPSAAPKETAHPFDPFFSPDDRAAVRTSLGP